MWDTETRVDVTQRLTFGSYRFIKDGDCLTECLFSADDLNESERDVLAAYVSINRADVADQGITRLELLSRSAFLKRFFRLAYKGRVLVINFNTPFDVSRIAVNIKPARGKFAGGFSLGLWTYRDASNRERHHQQRPRIAIKHIDSKRALIRFTGRSRADPEDLIPDDSETGAVQQGYRFHGHFLDLRTLAFALTDRGHSLESASEAFQVEDPKIRVTTHGMVTPDYIDYSRRDVLATAELATKLLEEYDRHPIGLPVTRALSPAAIGKSYLRAMGIPPVLERQPDFPLGFLGHAQTAFFGGRTSAHVRRITMPVVYTDFLSMYPTVNSLMGLWRFVTAHEIRVVEHCQEDIARLLEACKDGPNYWFDPSHWPQLTAFVRVVPNGDVLPVRGKFAGSATDWQVAVSHCYAGEAPNESLWFALPDVVASVVLTGQVPQIVDAFRLEAHGTLDSLRTVKLRGSIEVDPQRQDFFKVVIEERKRLAKRSDLSEIERDRFDGALKVLANATSYGIYAEMHREESARVQSARCQSIEPESFRCQVAHPDKPGEYCFPPLASLITGAARLMLTLLEREVSALGGTYTMEDTDSMAIVSTKTGGLVACPGGRERLPDGRAAVRALTWADVDDIAERFRVLSPYDRTAITESALKIEEDNYDSTGQQRQLWCLAISAKRYALFLRDEQGAPVLLRKKVNNKKDRWSEHGLGHLLNPIDPDRDDREWIAQVWLNLIRRTVSLPTSAIGFEALPAVGRLAISSPPLLQPFERFNRRRSYPSQVKPFSFLSTCHVRPFGYPLGVDPQRFQLVAPYDKDSRHWANIGWVDRNSTKTFGITTKGETGDRQTARVSTYGEVIEDYAYHPEVKCADAHGRPSDRQTIGLLQRRHVRVGELKSIGKESNSVEEVHAGLVHDDANVYTEYRDPRRDIWTTKILPAVKKGRLVDLEKACKGRISRRALIDIRAGRSRPHPRNQSFLEAIVKRLGLL